jgi:hypothetical protein
MKLTSLNRVKNALGKTSAHEDGVFLRLIATASTQIGQHLRRLNSLQLTSRTEYFDPHLGQRVFRPKAYPIASVTSIHCDNSGKYSGSETLVPSTDYIVSGDSRAIHFTADGAYNDSLLIPPWASVAPKSVRIIYTGGLAADAVSSTWSKSASTFTAGRFIQGATSMAVGRIASTSSLSITYESIYGVFEAGETITEYATLNNALQSGGVEGAAPTPVTATLGAASSLSLAETYPDLVQACEMHVRYLYRNQDNFENIIVSKDGENRASRADLKNVYGFLPEIVALLDTYQNKRL